MPHLKGQRGTAKDKKGFEWQYKELGVTCECESECVPCDVSRV